MKTINWTYLLTEVFFLVLGLFLALELNDWSARRKVEQRKTIALQNIQKEIQSNIEELNGNGNNDELLALTQSIYPLQAEGVEPERGYLLLEISPAERDSLRKQYAGTIVFKDSSALGKNVRYKVRLNFELNLANLSDLAWETTKLGGLMDKFSFDCTKGILPAYQIQEKFHLQQDNMVNVYGEQDIPAFLVQVFFWKEYKNALNEEYKLALEGLEDCL